MAFTLLPFFMAAATGASSGPDLSERATAVTLDVERVMVFSDRARITRAGTVKWPDSGVVKIPDLPGNVMLDSIRVSADGGRVVRVEKKPVDRERWSIDQVDSWMKQLEEESDKIALANGRLTAARGSLSWIAGLEAAPPVLEKDRLGKAAPGLAPNEWRALLDKLGERRSSIRKSEKKLEQELKELYLGYDKFSREVQARNIGGFSDRKIEVLVIVDAERKEGRLTVEYAVAGASWKPAYELFFEPDARKVELKAAGLVSQATGEDWPNARLALSTAIPSLGIAVPLLSTWTLGDDRQFVPTPTARAAPRRVSTFAPPTPRPRVAELEREADRQLLATRTQQLLALAVEPRVYPDDNGIAAGEWFGSAAIAGGALGEGGAGVGYGAASGVTLGGASGGLGTSATSGHAPGYKTSVAPPPRTSVRARPPPAPPPPPPSMPEPAPPADYDYGADAPMTASESVREESVFGRAARAVGGLFDDDEGDARAAGPSPLTRGLALRQGQAWTRQTFSDPYLPAVSAGGFDYVYDAPVALTVPSQAQGMRVPLASRSYDVETFYEATPSLAPTAYLKATVKNGSKLPILAGPANVFVNRAFTGDATLQTTGPGGVLELPLGADENIRLTRTVVPQTKTQGFLIGEEDVTEYAVKIDVGNYKKKPVTIRVIDQIPKTNEEKIKVELIAATPKSAKGADADGLLYWNVDVPANGTKQVTFSYRITRPKGWRLSQ